MADRPPVSPTALRGFAAAVGFATLAVCAALGPIWFQTPDVAIIVAVLVLTMTTIAAALLALPLYLIALRFRIANFATAALAGTVTAALPAILLVGQDIASGDLYGVGWMPATLSAIGGLSGLLFWRIARPRQP